MITRENLPFIIADLEAAEVTRELEKPGNYIILRSHTFNAGSYASVESSKTPDLPEEDQDGNAAIFEKSDFQSIIHTLTSSAAHK